MNLLLNIVIYQAIWLLCVLFGNLGALLSLPLLVLHFVLSATRAADARLMAALVAGGFIIDGSLQAAGVLALRGWGWPIPIWLATIWLGLATLPHHSLWWMRSRLLVNILFGALGGPLAYWGGMRLGAASFPVSLEYSLLVLAVVWAVLWPLVMSFAVWGGSRQS
ncbi:MAG: hypothetical protein VR65_11050 [Desulfobulbaceae bacterium BRH_c16a]|nr:MAG: hypothetical protein VR65_11050 [Desulfobulbaceae bacterium BRH_c16a]